jgi:uncharacterized protein (TIGR02996 family)
MTTTTMLSVLLAVLALVLLIAYLTRRRRRIAGVGRDRFVPYTRALGCLIEGRMDEALGFLKEAVRQNPDDVHAYMRFGDLLRERGDAERALQVRAGSVPESRQGLPGSGTLRGCAEGGRKVVGLQ